MFALGLNLRDEKVEMTTSTENGDNDTNIYYLTLGDISVSIRLLCQSVATKAL